MFNEGKNSQVEFLYEYNVKGLTFFQDYLLIDLIDFLFFYSS